MSLSHARRKTTRTVVRRLVPFGLAAAVTASIVAGALWALQALLIVDQFDGRATHAMIWEHPRVAAFAADWLRERPGRRLLVMETEPPRVVAYGACPPVVETLQKELAECGVPADTIDVISGRPRGDWERVARLGAWLRRHSGARVLVPIDRFDTGRIRRTMDLQFPPDDATRTAVVSLPNPQLDGHWWFTTRDGWKIVLFAWLKRLFVECQGPGAPPPEPWDPDRYERDLRRCIGRPDSK